ncbi:hypothetical protein CALVIDRAFT_539421 [Calocera viscosa TUFC12733]|uniref:Uncharacterized protein n=1 Tax=Calocera viscosa (strain TUFC12733) TaxID=1330018 RepID=A0A167JXP1_CALVF|nr:hypothetical protein CALVIDRAFT_539421 [Calocera viscosa TUFC12733]
MGPQEDATEEANSLPKSRPTEHHNQKRFTERDCFSAIAMSAQGPDVIPHARPSAHLVLPHTTGAT